MNRKRIHWSCKSIVCKIYHCSLKRKNLTSLKKRKEKKRGKGEKESGMDNASSGTSNESTMQVLPGGGSGDGDDNYWKDVTSNPIVQLIFYAFYGNIFVLGVFGNALVCFVVARNRQMQTVTNLFITNLALSDVLLCVLAVPFTPLYTFLGGWIFGRTLCHLVPYAQGVSVYVSTLTLTSIAIDRFVVIVYPFHPRTRLEVCLSVILGIWIIALTVTLPYGLYMHLEEPETYCEEHWPNERFRKVFSSLTTILQFVLPFFVIVFCYTCVSIKLNDRARSKPGNKTGKREQADRERKKRTNGMLIAMVTVFGISWLPLNVVNVIDDFYSPANDWSYYRLCFFMAHCLAMSSTCYNPFLYAWLNDNFRKEFKQVLPCFSKRKSQGHGVAAAAEEELQLDKAPNGNNTVQESLLPSQTRIRISTPDNCELILLEPTTTNASRNLDDYSLPCFFCLETKASESNPVAFGNGAATIEEIW